LPLHRGDSKENSGREAGESGRSLYPETSMEGDPAMTKTSVFSIVAMLLSLILFVLAAGADTEVDEGLLDPAIPNLRPSPPGEEDVVLQNLEWESDQHAEEVYLDSDGTGPMTGDNKITIYIASSPSTAGSDAEYIYMDFGPDDNLRLLGYSTSPHFPLGATMTWDLNQESIREFMENLQQESWDYITLRTVSGDGIKIERVKLIHSSETILDWNYDDWLDSPNDSHVGLAARTLWRKVRDMNLPVQAAVNFGVRDLGKTDGYKYGTGNSWCSEFASWCLRRDGWDTPTGSIGTSDMRSFFSNLGRLYTQAQILNGTYIPASGDYFSLWDGGHSVILAYWVDDPSLGITESTRYVTIEGNCGQAVRTVTRDVGDIDHVGKAQ